MTGRPLRIGVAGLGRAFSLMLPTFVGDDRVALVAACDPRPAAREQFTREFGTAYDSVEALAADPAVEVLYIASPHQHHAAHARIAAANGRHVLIEKPMALTLAECDAMVDACSAAGVRLIVGHSHSFDAPYLETRRLVDSGDFGRVRMIHALNYTDFLYRPRRPEELATEQGGGVVFSQAAHQVDVVRLLAGAPALRVRAATGAWDAARPTEGAYIALLWFDGGAFASLTYSGYGHFDSDGWCEDIGELGQRKEASHHGAARRRLMGVGSAGEEAQLKAAGTYGGPAYRSAPGASSELHHQHFGPLIVSCERADLRPLPDAIEINGDTTRERRSIGSPAVPRREVIDELWSAVREDRAPLHDGVWARATLEVCTAILDSARSGVDVVLRRQSAG